ncbi:MAG: regulatory protein FmdB family [Myxococcales bacterium]|nr:regulatory protein FmdB family [Myxococcales bacterium]
MPTYEYECKKCGKRFEYFQSMSEAKKTECEECKGELERLISASGFILKGGGWYKDLYSSTKKPDSKSSDSSSSSSSSSSTTTSTTPSTTTKSEKSDKKE